MKIARVTPLRESVPPKYYGGNERVVSYITEEMVRRTHEVKLFSSRDPAMNPQRRAGGLCGWINIIKGQIGRNQEVSEAA